MMRRLDVGERRGLWRNPSTFGRPLTELRSNASSFAAVLVTLASLVVPGCESKEAEPLAPREPGVFLDRSATSGIDFVHDPFGDGRKFLVEINGGCVCMIDHDGDGDLDLLFGQGAPLRGSEPDPDRDLRDRLYRNDGSFRFTDVTEETGAWEDGYTLSILAPDYDGDGDQDLYFCNFGANRLLRNDGGTFVEVTDVVGLASSRWSSSGVFADFDQDGDLDFYLCNYVIDDLNHPGCGELERGEEWRSYCDPGVFHGSHDQLFRNDGGRFVDVTKEAGMGAADGNGLAVVLSDYDDDGDVDLFVANDQSPNFLWRNEGDLRFTNVADVAGVAVGSLGAAEACMGTDWADIDGDGDFDLIAANLSMETNTLYVNQSSGSFRDRSEVSGVGIPSLLNVGFGCEFFDADFDGDSDLMVVNGHVIDNIHLYEPSQVFEQPPQFFVNDGKGRFTEISTRAGDYFGGQYVARGLATGDLDGDGDPDVVVANNRGKPAILENAMADGASWIGFELQGSSGNSQALGAKVTVIAGDRRWIEEVRGTSSYAAFQDLRIQIGLGRRTSIDRVEVRWPDGAVTSFDDLDVQEYHLLSR